ncbi:hypothetical protein [Sorangium sp. So ce1153]|uniref:hypothetical protein n=1 Tax=Sorangium sp. So ce1153 TaxID=3133333 RepID=UPI003F5E335E
MVETEVDPEIPLPPLQEAALDEATLDRLFLDIAEAAELVSVSLKADATARAGDVPRAGRDELVLARRALRDGTALGAQIRYRFAGSEWCDTLLRMPSGVRLVRVRMEDALGACAAPTSLRGATRRERE